MKIFGVIASCLVVASVVQPTAAYCRAWRVEQDGSGEYLLIQEAVNAAADGDTILIGPGRYDDLQPRGANQVVCVARWDDNRKLSFIGVSADDVIIGPTTYVPVEPGPQGIHQHEPADCTVENVTFSNLYAGVVAGRGTLNVAGVRFDTGYIGVYTQFADTCIVGNCTFRSYANTSIAIFNTTFAEASNCTLANAQIYFGESPKANVRDCVVTEGGFVVYSNSGGKIERCRTQCGTSTNVYIDSDITLELYDNTFVGGGTNITAGWATIVAERNSFLAPTDYWNFDLYNATISAHNNDIQAGVGATRMINTLGYPDGTTATVDMGNNYWGEHSNAAALDSLIYDGNDDPNIHVIVNYEPIRTESVPVKKKSLGGLKALFLGR